VTEVKKPIPEDEPEWMTRMRLQAEEEERIKREDEERIELERKK
jgi:hypothetical protein